MHQYLLFCIIRAYTMLQGNATKAKLELLKGYERKFSTNINMEVKTTLKTNNIQCKHEPETNRIRGS